MTIIYCHVLNLKCHRSIREETTIYYSLYKQKTPVRSLLLIQGYAFPAVSRRTDHDRNPKNSNPRDAPDGEHLQAHCDYPIYTQGNGEVLLPTCRKEGAVRPSPTTRKHLMQTMWEGNRPGGKTQEADLLLQGMLSEVVELPPISGKPIFKIPIPLHLPCMWQILHRLWQ